MKPPAEALGYRRWLAVARRHSRRASDSEDLLQEALLAAFEAGRSPLSDPADSAWFHGVLERLAAFRARAALRVAQREARFAAEQETRTDEPLVDHAPESPSALMASIGSWPASQRSVLLLALHGLDREEVRRMLDVSDTALRQRLTAIRKRLAGSSLDRLIEPFQRWLAGQGSQDTGLRRAALARGPARVVAFRMGVSDPDGHLLGLGAPRRPKR